MSIYGERVNSRLKNLNEFWAVHKPLWEKEIVMVFKVEYSMGC